MPREYPSKGNVAVLTTVCRVCADIIVHYIYSKYVHCLWVISYSVLVEKLAPADWQK